MSSTAPADPTRTGAATGSKKKNKKKKNANKPKEPANVGNGPPADDHDKHDDEPKSPIEAASQDKPSEETPPEDKPEPEPEPESRPDDSRPATNGHPVIEDNQDPAQPPSDAAARLQTMTEDRDALRAEVEQLRRQLEESQSPPTSDAPDVERLKAEVEEANAAREDAEERYQGLLERVERIKAGMLERLTHDKEELRETKERLEELEGEKAELEEENERLRRGAAGADGEAGRMRDELRETEREVANLRSRSNLAAQNWQREKDQLEKSLAHVKEELAMTGNAMDEWEVIAMEERSVKEGLEEKVRVLEDQISERSSRYDSVVAERDAQSQALDRLQQALREIQDARKKELREMVEQAQVLERSVQEADGRVAKVEEEKEKLVQELERCVPFEKEVREKNLLIGKLRHEAIVLNDHLTKALRFLKKMKPEDNVDRQIVTNHLLHFLALDRSDPKRFQILQVMAGYLDWTDEQREQAGLARPGTSGGSLKLPLSPFHRSPSTASLSTEFMSDSPGGGKESLAELWAGFLERSAEQGAEERSRKDSASSAATGVTRGEKG